MSSTDGQRTVLNFRWLGTQMTDTRSRTSPYSTRRGRFGSHYTKDMKVSFHNIPEELVEAEVEATVDVLTSMCNKIRKTDEHMDPIPSYHNVK